MFGRGLPLPLLALFALAGPASRLTAATPVDFSRDIQPLLSENCYHCHGPDEKARKAKLRLDRREGAFHPTGDGAIAVVPGRPDESELIKRIFSTDPEEVMPNPASHRELTAAQKDLLRRWVAEGAPWAEHWAFVPPQRAPLPTGSVRHPVDAFLQARLNREKLTPAPLADRTTLLRRVTLDLTGLPPTPAEVDAFLADATPEAYERAVDRLLASPRYGERMVWDWLDAARYADTNGFQADPTRTMWPWRDWAIRAFNANQPFDQFTVEQLAGDLLPEATRDQRLATGFNRNHMLNNEGGTIPEESRVGYVMDRVETMGTLWLGLTVGCARCHDHKFDPLSQREYYQFFAYFNQVPEKGNADANPMAKPLLSLATTEEEAKVAGLRRQETAAKAAREKVDATLAAGQPAWEQRILADGLHAPEPVWTPIKPEDLSSENGAKLTVQPDGSILVAGAAQAQDDFIITGSTTVRNLTALRIEALPDPSLPEGGPGQDEQGGFELSEFKFQADGRPIELAGVMTDESADGSVLASVLDNNPATGWKVARGGGRTRFAVFELRNSVGGGEAVVLSLRLEHRSSAPRAVMGRFRISVTNTNATTLRPLSAGALAALRQPAAERTAAAAKEISDWYLALSPERDAALRRQDEAKRRADAADKALLRVMVMEDKPGLRESFILDRGAYDQPGAKVTAGTPAFLPPLPPEAAPNRLSLARWLVSPDHPLTARVTVNRYWAMLFGVGLVKTANDFGLQGEKPVHPELLDWLARDFIDSGWDVKRLLRLMVTSQAYRQSSAVTPALHERDPENRLLARGPRFRLPSWMLRDQALAASGLLVEKLGGPGFNGYQPAGIWEEATFGRIKYQQDKGEAIYRRSVYLFWRRIVGPTVFFDTANRQVCTVDVGRTNTPLHALTTLNDPTYVEAARVLAERTLRDGGTSDAARITFAFRRCTARPPTPREIAVLEGSLARWRRQFGARPEEARTFIRAGDSTPDASLGVVELAAHTALGSLLLNLDETLTKE